MPVNQTANPQQEAFALAQLQRLFGGAGDPYKLAPSSGPYNWPGQAEVGGTRAALDGQRLGGINLGYVNDIYGQHPGDSSAADARMKEIFGQMFQVPQGGQVPGAPPQIVPQAPQVPQSTPATPSQVQNLVPPVAAGPSAGAQPSQAALPLSFSEDMLGQKLGGTTPQGAPSPQMPQGSAFSTPTGQNTGMGMQQLNQLIQLLRAKGVPV